MKILGYMVVIKRTGVDGTPIPLTNISCSVGRNVDCDIRVTLPTVSSQHCRIDVDPSGKAYITNVSQCNHTLVNDSPLAGHEVCILGHKDIITIADRQFRWEYPEGCILTLSVKRDQMINYKILTPTTQSPVSPHDLNGSGGKKRTNDEEDDLDMQEAKRKKVSFGPQLNPEHFDKLLPPATPVSKGEKPNTQSLLNLPENPCLNTNIRKSLRVSHATVDVSIAEESVLDTPTKSLLRRRSPTPVKPYIARSLGLFTSKLLDAESCIKTPADESSKQKLSIVHEGFVANGPTHDVPAVNKCPKFSPEKSPRLISSEFMGISDLVSPKCPEAYMDSGLKTSPKKVITPQKSGYISTPEASTQKIASPKAYTENVCTLKTTPKKDASPKISPKRSATQTTPGNLRTPETYSRKLFSPKTSPNKLAPPKTSKKLENFRASYKHVGFHKVTPKKATSPRTTEKKLSRATPKKATSPRTTVKKPSPRATPKKATSPRTTVKNPSPKATPKKATSPGSTEKNPSPRATPKKATSPRTTEKKPSPKATPQKATSPRTTEKNPSPRATPKKATSPRTPKRNPSPRATPKKATSPRTPKRNLSPRATPKKATSPRAALENVASPDSSHIEETASPKQLSENVESLLASPKVLRVTLERIPTPTKVSPETKFKAETPSCKKFALDITSPEKVRAPQSPTNLASPTSSMKIMSLNSLNQMVVSPPKMVGSPKKVVSPQASPKSSPEKTPPSKIISKEASPNKATLNSLKQEVSALLKAQRNYPKEKRHVKRKASMTPKLSVSKRTAATPKSGRKLSILKGKTPARLSGRTPKKSWADVLKSGLMAYGMPPSNTQNSKQVMQRTKNASTMHKVKLPGKHFSMVVAKSFASGKTTTGHVNSPAPIFIHKKTSKTPRVFRKGRKIAPRAGLTKSATKSDAYLDGLGGLMATPKSVRVDNAAECSDEITSPKGKRRYSKISVVSCQDSEMVETPGVSPRSIRNTPEKSDKDPDSVTKSHSLTPTELKTPAGPSAADLMESLGDSPAQFSPTTPNALNCVPSIGRRPLSYISTSTSYINTTNFDFSSVRTPDVTEDNYVSPLETPATLGKTPEYMFRSPKDKVVVTPPEDIPLETDVTTFDFENAHTPDFSKDDFVSPMSTRSKFTTPRVNYSLKKSPRNRDLFGTNILSAPKLMNETPKGAQPNVQEMKRLLCTPKTAVSTPKGDGNKCVGQKNHGQNASFETGATVSGIEESSALNGTAEYAIVGKQLRTPKSVPGSPKADHTNDADVMKLRKTACVTAQKSPEADITNVTGSKMQMTQKVTITKGKTDDKGTTVTRRVLRTPRPMAGSPMADYTNVAGLKKLMKSPNATAQDSPEADYTNVAGLKKLMKTPNSNIQESPQADYTNVKGVKKLLKSPKVNVPEREADYAHVVGIRKILRTPKPRVESPKANYTDVSGVKKLMKTPIPKECTADYSNVTGMKRLLRTPRRAPKETGAVSDYNNEQNLQKILKTPRRKTKERYSNYHEPKGLKKLLATPRQKQFSPLSDYTNVTGVKNILATPRSPVKSPKADYTNVHGVRALMRTPKVREDFVDVDLQGLGHLLKTPLADQTNVVVGRAVELADHSSTPSSGRKLRRSPKVASPATSSPSENIPPQEGIKRNAEVLKEQVQDGGSTPRRSRRNAKAGLQEVSIPVRRGRPRKGTVKEADSIENDVDGSVLKLIKTSPVVPERRLRTKKGICYDEDSTETVIRTKSRRTQKARNMRSQDSDLIILADIESSAQTEVIEHKHYDDSIDKASKLTTKERQHSSPKTAVSFGKVVIDISSPLTVDLSPLPGSRRRNHKQGDLDLPITTRSRRGKQTRLNKEEESTKSASTFVENTVPNLSNGKGVEMSSAESVPTRKRRKQTEPDVAEEETKAHTPLQRRRGRRKAAEAIEVSKNGTSKKQAQSVHGDEYVDTGTAEPEIISENKPTPKVRKSKVKDGELDCVQEVTEICTQIQVPSKEDEVSLRRGRRKGAEKPETGLKRPLRGRKNCAKQTHEVQDKSESTSDPPDDQEVVCCTISDDSASECQTAKRKRGNNRSNSKKKQEIVTVESSEETTEEEQKSACGTSTTNMENTDLVSKSMENEENEPDVLQYQTRHTRSKNQNDRVETPPCKRRAHATIERVTTTRVTRSRNESTKTKESPVKATRQTRSRK